MDRKDLPYIVNIIAAGCAFFLLLPERFYSPIVEGLDGSWQLGLHLARLGGLVFGRDFVFTFGPLGVTNVRLPFPGMRLPLLVFDFLFYLNLLVILCRIIRRQHSWLVAPALVAVAVVIDRDINFGGALYVLLVSAGFYLALWRESEQGVDFICAMIIVTYLFYARQNFGFAAILLLGLSLVHSLIAHESKGTTFAYGVSAASLIVAAAVLLKVDLYGYLIHSLSLMGSYSEAMSLGLAKHPVDFWLALGLAALLLLGGLLSARDLFDEQRLNLSIFVAMVALLVLLFKIAFVREFSHFSVFFKLAPLALGLGPLFFVGRSKRIFSGVFFLGTAISLALNYPKSVGDLLDTRLTGLSVYVDEATAPESSLGNYLDGKSSLPDVVRTIVDQGSVDIIPWEISRIFFSELQYNPRPVIQSYAAYNPQLDRLNRDKYLSPNRPHSVLYEFRSMDWRYPLFDEGQTTLALLAGYQLVLHREPLLVLKAVTPIREPVIDQRWRLTTRFGVPLEVIRSSSLVYCECSVSYTTLGQFASWFYRPPELRIGLNLSDGSSPNFRMIRGNMASGVPINKYVGSLADAAWLFLGELDKLRDIRSITFETAGSWAYEPDVECEFMQLGWRRHSPDNKDR